MNTTLHGIGASRGVARGAVKIITSEKNIAEFQPGDVLVTKITDPTMVAIMAKAAAIVCDIGSITSHPSIVSREMGIPCVVNTKQATNMLRDGIMVEVDGEKGTVISLEGESRPLNQVDQNRDIDEFLDAFVPAIKAMDFNTFSETISWDRYDPLIAKSWLKRIFILLDAVERERLTPMEVARLFPNPTELRENMLFDLWSAKYASVTRAERLRIFAFYSQALRALCLEDPYARVKNVIHAPEKLYTFLVGAKRATIEDARQLGRLISACYHLGHAMYSDMHPSIVYDNFGPYDVAERYGRAHSVVVKDFGNLRAPELWPESSTLPGDRIIIVCLYEGVIMRIDSTSHVVYDGDVIGGLRQYRLLVDGLDFPIADLASLTAPLEAAAGRIFRKFQSLGFAERKARYFLEKAYSYRWLGDRLGLPWQPGDEILAEARNKPLHPIQWPQDKEAQKKFCREILDPRIEVLPIGA
ncbi:MAG: hypothetical protein HY984_00595 [Candidatus Magasanikbacteria bacterium]|nr:hypothetical protein [Candidatus Magasanikbacteria bacterium]